MNFSDIFLSALIGGVGGLVGAAVSQWLVPKKWHLSAKPKLIITLIFVISPSTFYNSFIGPQRRQANIKEKLDTAFSSMGQMGVFFDLIKSNDNQGYQEFLEKASKTLAANSNLSSAQLTVRARDLGAELTVKYYKKAADEAILEYSTVMVKVFSNLLLKNPLYFCKMQSPEVFGSLSREEFSQIPDQRDWLKAFEAVVRSAMKSQNLKSNYGAVTYKEEFDADFSKRFPKETEMMNLSGSAMNEKSCPAIGKSFVRYLSNINDLPQNERVAIWRYRLGGL